MLQAVRVRRYLTAAIIGAAILAAAVVKFSSSSVPTGSATVQIVVDSPQSALADLQQDPAPLVTRAPVFAQLMTSDAVLRDIAHVAGIRPKELTAEGPYSGGGQPLDVPNPSEARSAQLIASNAAYHFTFVADATIPMVTASVEGPNPAAAGKIANAVGPGVQAWLSALQVNVPAGHRVTIRELGSAQAGVVNGSSSVMLAGIAAVAVLLIGLLAIWALERRATDEPRLRPNETRLSPNGTRLSPNGTHLSPNEPHLSPDEPHLSPDEPHLSPDEPHLSPANGNGREPMPAARLPHGLVGNAARNGARARIERAARRSTSGHNGVDAALEQARRHGGLLLGADELPEDSGRTSGAR